ncbi:uncharacterized protein [Hetaerina americana]|uniref:uncharacterized protein n=1 Tax=Hetaerina americana TaxID=62018 RepID=UPI003A7F32B0
MMSSAWKPLPDKENPACAIMTSFKVRASGPVKISNRGAIPKKQVFGDLKNTIQNFKAESEECGITKDSKPGNLPLSSDGKLRNEDWPEPESLPINLTVEDDFEDCFLPGLKFSNFELEDLSDIIGKINKPLEIEPDSPFLLPQGRIPLDVKLDFPDEDFYDLKLIWNDSI